MKTADKKIKQVEKSVTALMKSPEWRRYIEKSDKQTSKTLEKLKQDSKVDPRLLDEPATV